MASPSNKTFLFSIDLEDIRLRMENGRQYKERVPHNTTQYLNWLRKYNAKCTFFTNGDVAELYPSLIQQIVSEGHEIACHTNEHIAIDQQTPAEFKRDLEKNIEALIKAGANNITGFRAPFFSLIEKTKWVYDVLAEMNFTYSSSVLPAKNPLYGWEGFSRKPLKMNDKILEIPMTVGQVGPLTVPAVGGVYFRAVPVILIRRLINQTLNKGLPVLSYFHPYDVDTEQESFMHPGINNNMFYNFLINYNRQYVFTKLDKLMDDGLQICTYREYVKSVS